MHFLGENERLVKDLVLKYERDEYRRKLLEGVSNAAREQAGLYGGLDRLSWG